MAEPIFVPGYWAGRLADAIHKDRLHFAVYRTTEDVWEAIAEAHRKILAKEVAADTSILDVGCGWGRLLSLLPSWWSGMYLGVDVSPDFIDLARRDHPGRLFVCRDCREPMPNSYMLADGTLFQVPLFDLAVLVSVRHMVIGNAGEGEWDLMHKTIRAVSRRILYLEYDVNDSGQVEVVGESL